MQIRYIAHIRVEADTPLKVGGNESDFMKDSPIQKDWNGLPMILGTSIAGVLRKDFGDEADEVFGSENGSKVIISNALLVDEKGQVHEELLLKKTPFLELFDSLPQREHTAITDKGTVKEHSKFDEEIVYKGTQFAFALEMLEDQEAFEKLLAMLQSPAFRVGGGSTKGFGKLKVLEIRTAVIDTPTALAAYTNSLNNPSGTSVDLHTSNQTANHTIYSLKITPDDFFMFGSGLGDEDADQIPVVEKIVDYGTKGLSHQHILMPASSLKGAIAHRTTYHYNLQNGFYIGDDRARLTIAELFGEAKNSKQDITGSRGKLLFSDLFKEDRKEQKVFDHVAIDRFTGGAMEGALFQEKTTAQHDTWEIEILMEHGVEEPFVQAFEATLDDICSGGLALGGATTKGHGIFTGTWSKS